MDLVPGHERYWLDTIINPFILYGAIALGAIGVCLALPASSSRRGVSPQLLGALIAATAAGLVILFLTKKAHESGSGLGGGSGGAPVPFFYIFGLITLGSALRVITHPKPVYAALWFIMVVIASAGLFLLLSAEFMTAALLIVYAGAILITYLFVIMLATQEPEAGQEGRAALYDTTSREPISATIVGFIMLGVLTTMIFRGLERLPVPPPARPDAILAQMPRKVEATLRGSGQLKDGESAVVTQDGSTVVVTGADKSTREIAKAQWPTDLRARNSELVGFNLLRDHPGTIEIAGVILLMAMLGAVVLSRKQVQLDDEAKMRQARTLAGDGWDGASGGRA